MTRIKLTVKGAQTWVSVSGSLTSGMVGIPVTIKYDETWNGLTKNLVCRCSRSKSDIGECRAILNVGETATVAYEVMRAGMHLYLGIEGHSSDGELVIPTKWVDCGEIHAGANTGADLSADPTLPVWNQLQTAIEQIKRDPFPQEQMTEIQACAQSALRAANTAADAADDAARAAQDAALSAVRAEAAAARAENAVGALPDPGNGGLNETAVNLLVTILRSGMYSTNQSANITALEAALGDSGGSDDGGDSGGSSDPTGIDIPPENLLGYYDMSTALTGSSHITDLSGNGRDILFYPNNGYYADGCLYRGDKLSDWSNSAAEYGITDGAAGKYAYGENITFFVTFVNSLSGTTPLLNLGSNPNAHKQMLVFQKGIILYRQAGFNDVSGSTKLTENVRTTVCAVITPTEEKIYINGVLKSSSAAKTSEYGDGFRLLTGYSNSSADADTKIFNAAVYDAALTDTEIAAISATLLKNAGGDA